MTDRHGWDLPDFADDPPLPLRPELRPEPETETATGSTS